jgi:hypothetical protein
MNHNQKKIGRRASTQVEEKDYFSTTRILSKIPKDFLIEKFLIRKDILEKKGYDIEDYTREVCLI